MKHTLTQAALVLAGAASICAAPAGAARVRGEGARGEGEGHLLRLRLRPGDEWRERVLHEVEVVGDPDGVVWSLRLERVETVRVLSLVTGLDAAAGGPARRWARVRRTPEPTPADPAPPGPYEVLVSSLGEIALPPPEKAQSPGNAPRAALLAGLASRYAPVLPEDRLVVGGEASRVMRLRFASGARSGPDFTETETVTLSSVEGASDAGKGGGPRRDVAVLVIGRRAGPQTVALADAAWAAPAPGALVVAATPEELDLVVHGASGDGELRFDPVGGALLSYRVCETVGLAAKLGRSSVRRTVNVRFEIERLEQP
ncbi:MAG: hypothetical protein ACYTKD_21510 [Planctomycetota bacterium]|jgi:hypothetical protein